MRPLWLVGDPVVVGGRGVVVVPVVLAGDPRAAGRDVELDEGGSQRAVPVWVAEEGEEVLPRVIVRPVA